MRSCGLSVLSDQVTCRRMISSRGLSRSNGKYERRQLHFPFVGKPQSLCGVHEGIGTSLTVSSQGSHGSLCPKQFGEPSLVP